MRPYKIIMSRGDNIQIDHEELPKILESISSKQPVITKSAIFNPSFFVSVVLDSDRWKEFRESMKYNDDYGRRIKSGELKIPPLRDLFEGVRARLAEGSAKMITR